MGKIIIAGAILALLGVLGLATPYFTTTATKNVATVGDLKLNTSEDTGHFIPPGAAGGILALGVILIGIGVFKRS